jgi:hypothetical protein
VAPLLVELVYIMHAALECEEVVVANLVSYCEAMGLVQLRQHVWDVTGRCERQVECNGRAEHMQRRVGGDGVGYTGQGWAWEAAARWLLKNSIIPAARTPQQWGGAHCCMGLGTAGVAIPVSVRVPTS